MLKRDVLLATAAMTAAVLALASCGGAKSDPAQELTPGKLVEI